MSEIILDGMHGLGDNFHQRAVIRHYLKQGFGVTLITPWPQIYYDLPINILIPPSPLRIQNKNIDRFKDTNIKVLSDAEYKALKPKVKRIWYTAQSVQHKSSILGAMVHELGITDRVYDFSFEPAKAWLNNWNSEIGNKIKNVNPENKPVMFYRPLIERVEWAGCANRNPNKKTYDRLINFIKDRFFVVSVADCKDKIEWISGGKIDADIEFHNGELNFEMMSCLMYNSDLVFCSPGFALVAAQAMGIPNICVYGGRENSIAYNTGNLLAFTLGINPIKPCLCFNHLHNCDKTINEVEAENKIAGFIEKYVNEKILLKEA